MNPQESISKEDIRFLNPSDLKLIRDAFGKLQLALGEATYENVNPVRTYPLSAPTHHIALLDAQQKEIGLIKDMTELEAESQRVLQEALEIRYFTARVLAIQRVQSRFGVTTWNLETDRGPREVHLKDRTDIRRLPDHRIILIDVYGVKYEIANTATLDKRSQTLLEAEI